MIYPFYRQRNLVFLYVLIAVITLIFKGTPLFSFNSIETYEQWVNLTNQMFYGHQDFLFSYGPLFWLVGGASVAYSPLVFFCSLFFTLFYFGCFWVIFLSLSLQHRALLFFTLICVLYVRGLFFMNLFPLLPVFIVYFFEFKPQPKQEWLNRSALLIGFGFYSALLFYIRFYEGVIALLTFGSYLTCLACERLRFKGIVLYLAALVLFYGALGILIFHNFSAVFQYFFLNSQLSFGNSIEMPEADPTTNSMWLYVALIFIIQNFIFRKNIRLLVMIDVLFLFFMKLGFSRIDHYYIDFIIPMAFILFAMTLTQKRVGRWSYLLVTGLLMLILYSGLFNKKIIETMQDVSQRLPISHVHAGYLLIPIVFILFAIALIRKRLGKWFYLLIIGMLILVLYSAPVHKNIIKLGQGVFQESQPISEGLVWHHSYWEQMENLYRAYQLNPQIVNRIGSEPVDVYPFANEYIFANGFNYHYRPLFQSYMTLTPKLDAQNADFLEGVSRPKFILWHGAVWSNNQNGFEESAFSDVDNRYELNLDPLTVEAIFNNYHVVDKTFGYHNTPILVLEKNQAISQEKMKPLFVQDMTFGQWINVPQDTGSLGVIKLIPNFQFTVWGHLKNTLLRGNIVNVHYQLKDGSEKIYRLNILNSVSGVWISPYYDNLNFTPETVEKVMFTVDAPHYFKSHFQGKWMLFDLNLSALTASS